MDKTTEELLEKIRLIKNNLDWNDACRKTIIEDLKKWTKLGDILIDNYNILNYNDCSYIMSLLQNRIDYLRLLQEYSKIREELGI